MARRRACGDVYCGNEIYSNRIRSTEWKSHLIGSAEIGSQLAGCGCWVLLHGRVRVCCCCSTAATALSSKHSRTRADVVWYHQKKNMVWYHSFFSTNGTIRHLNKHVYERKQGRKEREGGGRRNQLEQPQSNQKARERKQGKGGEEEERWL